MIALSRGDAETALAELNLANQSDQRVMYLKAKAMKAAGVETIEFETRDGLATINGSNLLTAMSAIHIYDMERIIKQAEIAAAMSARSSASEWSL